MPAFAAGGAERRIGKERGASGSDLVLDSASKKPRACSCMNIRLREMKSQLRVVAQEPKDLPRPKYLDPADPPETQKISVARE